MQSFSGLEAERVRSMQSRWTRYPYLPNVLSNDELGACERRWTHGKVCFLHWISPCRTNQQTLLARHGNRNDIYARCKGATLCCTQKHLSAFPNPGHSVAHH